MTEKDQVLKAIDESGVRAGQSWRHFKGGRYTIVAMAIDEATLSPVVVYAGHDGVVWTRRLAFFLQNVVVDGDKEVPRFIKIDDDGAATKPFERVVPEPTKWRPQDGFEQRPEASS